VKPYVDLGRRLGHGWMEYDSGSVVGYILGAQRTIHERELRLAVETVQDDLEMEAELDAEGND
jgi:hypothetical protein